MWPSSASEYNSMCIISHHWVCAEHVRQLVQLRWDPVCVLKLGELWTNRNYPVEREKETTGTQRGLDQQYLRCQSMWTGVGLRQEQSLPSPSSQQGSWVWKEGSEVCEILSHPFLFSQWELWRSLAKSEDGGEGRVLEVGRDNIHKQPSAEECEPTPLLSWHTPWVT